MKKLVKNFKYLVRYYSTNQDTIEKLLENATSINIEYFECEDISAGCGSMFNILVVSEDFEGKKHIEKHKVIHNILKEEIPNLHGMSITTKTPEEYENFKKEEV